nr:zinc finger protein 879 isoform X5 [Microcebus murinus]
MPQEARVGITPHIRRLLDAGILLRCQSAWNTPLLPVKKPGGKDYQPVQDLREVNTHVLDIHPTVPNPYTLLSSLPPTQIWYTVLDLKDAFFSLAVAPHSQEILAFEWQDEERGIQGQLTWTRLPQGFKNLPTLFNKALHKDLDEKKKIAKRVLTLALGPWRRPVAYLSKKKKKKETRPGSRGMAGLSANHQIMAATALLVKDTNKLTLGQHLQSTTPHAIEGILKQPPGRRITNARLTLYQGLLLDTPRIEFRTPAILNPATLLPDPEPETPEHSCLEILAETQMARKDLKDHPLPNSDLTWFTDESSFVPDGHSTNITWAKEKLQATQSKDGWLQDGEHRLVVPEALKNLLLGHLHQTKHLGKRKMLQLLDTAQIRFKSQGKIAEDIVRNCRVCQVMQPGRIRGTHAGTRERGRQPRLFWEIDFTEVDGVATWIHHSHVRPAGEDEQKRQQDEWRRQQTSQIH